MRLTRRTRHAASAQDQGPLCARLAGLQRQRTWRSSPDTQAPSGALRKANAIRHGDTTHAHAISGLIQPPGGHQSARERPQRGHTSRRRPKPVDMSEQLHRPLTRAQNAHGSEASARIHAILISTNHRFLTSQREARIRVASDDPNRVFTQMPSLTLRCGPELGEAQPQRRHLPCPQQEPLRHCVGQSLHDRGRCPPQLRRHHSESCNGC